MSSSGRRNVVVGVLAGLAAGAVLDAGQAHQHPLRVGQRWRDNVNIALQTSSLMPRRSLIRMNSAMCRL